MTERLSSSEYLQQIWSRHQSTHPKASVRGWARKLGLKGPSLLVMVMKGERRVSVELLTRLSSDSVLTRTEKKVLEATVLKERTPILAEVGRRNSKIDAMLSADRKKMISLESYALIAEWQHSAIYELVGLERFQDSPVWIARELMNQISADEARASLERLIRCGLLHRDETGRVRKTHGASVTTPDDVASFALKKYHTSVLDKAKVALLNQSVEEREFGGVTIAIPAERLPELKRRMREFQDEIMNEFGAEALDDVYQLNLQFFRLTRSRKLSKTGKAGEITCA